MLVLISQGKDCQSELIHRGYVTLLLFCCWLGLDSGSVKDTELCAQTSHVFVMLIHPFCIRALDPWTHADTSEWVCLMTEPPTCSTWLLYSVFHSWPGHPILLSCPSSFQLHIILIFQTTRTHVHTYTHSQCPSSWGASQTLSWGINSRLAKVSLERKLSESIWPMFPDELWKLSRELTYFIVKKRHIIHEQCTTSTKLRQYIFSRSRK